MEYRSEFNVFKSGRTFIYGVADQILRNYDKKKCETILEGSNVITSLFFGILGILSGKIILIVLALTIGLFSFVIWLGVRHVISERDKGIDLAHKMISDNLEEEKNKYKILQEEHNALETKHQYLNALWAETTLISREISRIQRNNSAKQLYTKLASSITAMVCRYSTIEKEQFSVYIYVYDGKTEMVRRVEVSTCVTSLQTALENKATKLSDVEEYFYAKCISSKQTTFSLSDNSAIRGNFFFLSEEDTIIKHYSQYAAMSYNLGDKMKLYVEVISYDDAKLDSNLDDFISKVIAPFSALVAIIDWRRIRSGLE